MYAAAGGASLASRQKRKNQAALNVKNKALLQQGLKDKLAASRASSLAAPTKAQSRQFHNLPSTYLRTPHAHVRKLSGGYTTQSRLLLPINESNSHLDTGHPHHQNFHSYAQSPPTHPLLPHPHHHAHPTDHASAASASRKSISHSHTPRKHLTKSHTACIPLVSHYDQSPPGTPTCLFKQHYQPHLDTDQQHIPNAQSKQASIQIPCDDIIVTPATPLPSPGPPTADQLERKCSFYRGRKQLAYEESLKKPADTTTEATPHDDAPPYTDDYCPIPQCCILANGGGTGAGGEKWTDSEYCDSEHRQMGICTCDHTEVKCMSPHSFGAPFFWLCL